MLAIIASQLVHEHSTDLDLAYGNLLQIGERGEALRRLRSGEQFTALVEDEDLATLPENLAARLDAALDQPLNMAVPRDPAYF